MVVGVVVVCGCIGSSISRRRRRSSSSSNGSSSNGSRADIFPLF